MLPIMPCVTSVHATVTEATSTVDLLKCIRDHESRGDYSAENPTSTASGAYQFVDGTWRGYARLAGITVPQHAADAPPWLQDVIAAWAIEDGRSYAWAGSGCPL